MAEGKLFNADLWEQIEQQPHIIKLREGLRLKQEALQSTTADSSAAASSSSASLTPAGLLAQQAGQVDQSTSEAVSSASTASSSSFVLLNDKKKAKRARQKAARDLEKAQAAEAQAKANEVPLEVAQDCFLDTAMTRLVLCKPGVPNNKKNADVTGTGTFDGLPGGGEEEGSSTEGKNKGKNGGLGLVNCKNVGKEEGWCESEMPVKWSKMFSEKKTAECIDADDHDPVKKFWEYTCVKCYAMEHSMPLAVAKLEFLKTNSGRRNSLDRVHHFTFALMNAKARYPGMSASGLREISFETMTDLFVPLAAFTIRKIEQMERIKSVTEEERLLAEQLLATSNPIEQAELFLKLEALDWSVPDLAFQTHGKDEQQKFIFASSYSDEWVALPADPKTGEIRSAVRSWYICLSNDCRTLICSKDWDRFNKNDPMATGQRWYCTCCGARYKTAWGQVVEVMHDGDSLFFRAEIPEHQFEDIRAMSYESTLNPATPMDLFTQVPTAKPSCFDEIMRKMDKEGHFKMLIDPKTLPQWSWHQIYNFAGAQIVPSRLQLKTAQNALL